ncbi:MAG: DUF368 domain-containing protein [Bacteriovoracaceae bacterium]
MLTKFFYALRSSKGPQTPKEAFELWLKGTAMGVADLIPGVSGGTIAFILGIYDQLLTAVSSINKEFFKKVKEVGFLESLRELHIKFLFFLMLGIFSSMFTLSRVMHYLITEQGIYTWSFFFGLILASVPLIWFQTSGSVKEKESLSRKIIFFIFGAIFAYLVVGMIPVETPDQPWFIYICGIIGITAMILPGISGSFLLLMLGKYEMITGALKNPFLKDNVGTLSVFSLGALTGLLVFSKFLKYLLERFNLATMAFLNGVLLGSLRKVWPWKEVLETKVIRGKVRILKEVNVLPDFDQQLMIAIVCFFFGLSVIYLLEKKGSRD